ncbi:hypothetical protein FQN53_004374 [Emmonsiellopsis sp. PD_33]|nr:hypothetical protein FQN53_004374 [Emmonsiellopsis sp. PD_33]
MKLTTILTATLALAAAPLSSAWHLQLYKNQNYKGEIHDREGTMGQPCRNLAARHKNQVESMHWDSGHWVTECRVRLYNKDDCAGNSMANSGYGSWHLPAFSKAAKNKVNSYKIDSFTPHVQASLNLDISSMAPKRKPPTSPKAPTRKSIRLASHQRENKETTSNPSSRTRRVSTSLGDEPREVLRHGSQATDRINKYAQADRKNDDKVIPTLLALLEWLPDEGKTSFARDILESDSDDDLHTVFWNLVCGLLSPMKATSGNASVSSSPREKRENNAEVVVASSLPVSQGRDHEFRETCLQRDDYRCVVTRRIDTQRWEDLGRPTDVPFGDLEAAHIIPSAYASWNDHPTSLMNVTKAWELLYRYFPAIKRVGVSVENINDPSNGIMLRSHIRREFGKFRCAFVATVCITSNLDKSTLLMNYGQETPHVYIFKTFRLFPSDLLPFVPTDGIVTMQQGIGAEDVDLPSPVILDCHHRIAEILNASGMGQVIENLTREWEDVKTYEGHGSLDTSGRSDVSRVLEIALWQRVSMSKLLERINTQSKGYQSTCTLHLETAKISPTRWPRYKYSFHKYLDEGHLFALYATDPKPASLERSTLHD